tara:strand:- start:9912 stop:10256 length:345 start_codon:yes stop_codon:yes gene_type:complete
MTESILKRESPTIAASVRAKNIIIQSASELSSGIVETWERGFNLIWRNRQATPAEVLAELGTDAVEVFELSEHTVSFIGATLTGRDDAEFARILAKLAKIPATTRNEDGSVTID